MATSASASTPLPDRRGELTSQLGETIALMKEFWRLQENARSTMQRAKLHPVQRLSTRYQTAILVVYNLSNDKKMATRFYSCCLQHQYRKNQGDPAPDDEALPILQAMKSRVAACQEVVDKKGSSHMFRHCAQWVAECRLHQWLLQENKLGAGPDTATLANLLLTFWPDQDNPDEWLPRWKARLQEPRVLSKWGSHFRKHWGVLWTKMPNRGALDQQAIRTRVRPSE